MTETKPMTVGYLRESLRKYRDDAKVIVEHYCPEAPTHFSIKELSECGSGSGDYCIIKIA